MKFRSMLIIAGILITGNLRAQDITVENGALKFSTLAVYEKYAENTADRNEISKAAEEIKTLAISEAGAEESVYPEFLQMILNTDKIVGLGKFLVKIDLENHQALAIDGSVPNAYESLVSNDAKASGMMVFSDEADNALDVLENIDNGTLDIKDYQAALAEPEGLFRSCSGASVQQQKSIIVWDKDIDKNSDCPDQSVLYAMDNKLVYQKAIFYFSLQGKIKSIRGCSSTNWILVPTHEALLQLKGTLKYVKVNRCNSEINDLRADATQGVVLNWRGYEGGRALRKYDFNMDFAIKHIHEQGNYHPSPHYRIVYGY